MRKRAKRWVILTVEYRPTGRNRERIWTDRSLTSLMDDLQKRHPNAHSWEAEVEEEGDGSY